MKNALFTALLIAAVSLLSCNQQASLQPEQLRTEYLTDPLGIDITTPRLSWQINSKERGLLQGAYQVLVASSKEKLDQEEGDLWDSKKVSSDRSVSVTYAGRPLTSRTGCYWKVKVWDQKGNESAWSQPAHWTIGLLQPSDWTAKWTGWDSVLTTDKPRDTFPRVSARYFRKDFETKQNITKAVVYICGLGTYELFINGQRIGDQVLAPAVSEYNKRAYYNTFDITTQLQQGANAVGVTLGNGRFYTMRWGFKGIPPITHYGYPKMRLQLEITYNDGTTEKVISDDSWKVTAKGPVVANNEYDGEEYDANQEMPGWNKPGFPANGWEQAQLVQNPTAIQEAQKTEFIKVTETIKPISVKEVKPGRFIFDMGQNLVGWARLHVKGNKGTQVTLRFAERLQDDSTLYLANIRSAQVTDKYTLKGGDEEVWEPAFTYHGFRYVEVTGYPGKPAPEALEGRVVHDALDITGSFETSNDVINQVYKNAFWGIRGNYRSMPTDCPQRDERMGWLGDRGMGSTGESFMFFNRNLYAKWLQDIEDAQNEAGSVPDVAPTYWRMYSDNITWPGAYLLIANMLYNQYGDSMPIVKHYPSMKKWLYYMRDKYMKDNILTKDTYGDWCMPPESPELIHSKDPARKTPGDYLSTVFYYHMLKLMERFAAVGGHPDEVQEWRGFSEKVKLAFNNKFLKKDSGYYANNTATANVFALAYQLAPEGERKAVFKNIVDRTLGEHKGHISTGLVGAEWLMRTLSLNGRPDIAYQLATNTTYPSWGYMAKNGATTIWELWNGNTADPAMNSGNHVMLLGDLLIWYYECLAGIKADTTQPGFKHIVMRPVFPAGLDKVKAGFYSMYGPVKSEWSRKNGELDWQVTVPGNATAIIYIPAAAAKDVKEGNSDAEKTEGLRFLRMEDGHAVFEAGSGNYHFTVKGAPGLAYKP